MAKSKNDSVGQYMGKELGTYFRLHRNKVNLSQDEVAKQLGYNSPQFISNFERGLCMVPLNKIAKLIKLYKMNAEEVTDLMVHLQEQYIRRELNLKKKEA